MKKFYIKGTEILARKSERNYICAVVYKRENGSMIVYSCHSAIEIAQKKIAHLCADFSRHPIDFTPGYDPSKLAIAELEVR